MMVVMVMQVDLNEPISALTPRDSRESSPDQTTLGHMQLSAAATVASFCLN